MLSGLTEYRLLCVLCQTEGMKRSDKRRLARAAKNRAQRVRHKRKRPNPAFLTASSEPRSITDADIVRMHRDIAWANLFRAIVEVMPHALAKFKAPEKPADEGETIQ